MKKELTSKRVNKPQVKANKSLYSKEVLKVARQNIKDFKKKSDEGFLIRAKIDRQLRSI